MTTTTAPLPAGVFVRVPDQVYCHEHGCVHADTTDPYDMGQPDCHRVDHRPIYWRSRKGDYR